jgi:putative transposase
MPPYDPQQHHRRSIRLPGYDYSQTGAYFVTMVTHGRECLFGDILEGEIHITPVGDIVHREWERLTHRFPHVMLDSYVIMPNHIHGIIVITGDRRGTADSGDPLNLS